jgi:hypothetical protein
MYVINLLSKRDKGEDDKEKTEFNYYHHHHVSLRSAPA